MTMAGVSLRQGPELAVKAAYAGIRLHPAYLQAGRGAISKRGAVRRVRADFKAPDMQKDQARKGLILNQINLSCN